MELTRMLYTDSVDDSLSRTLKLFEKPVEVNLELRSRLLSVYWSHTMERKGAAGRQRGAHHYTPMVSDSVKSDQRQVITVQCLPTTLISQKFPHGPQSKSRKIFVSNTLRLNFPYGQGGIRTLGTLLTYTRFPIVLFRPLRHLPLLVTPFTWEVVRAHYTRDATQMQALFQKSVHFFVRPMRRWWCGARNLRFGWRQG